MKPLIEEHYHIQELINSQEKRTEDRNLHREIEKSKADKGELIRESKAVVLTDFYCRKCQEDFKSVAIKQYEVDWSNESQHIAFYKTKCFKGHWCVRFITDKDRDPYWSKSKLVAIDRGRHSLDLLQPYQEGFNLLYGKR